MVCWAKGTWTATVTEAKILSLLRGPRTEAGLEVTAEWLECEYRRGVTVSDAEMTGLNSEYPGTCP
jgi:hypothetical protein